MQWTVHSRHRRSARVLPGVWVRYPVFAVVALLLVAQVSAMEEPLEGGWVRFALTGRAYAVAEWGASSVLESDNFWAISRYDPGKALDGDPGTAWVEGAPGPGVGESIVLGFTHYPEALGFINGFARNRNLFLGNHRVKVLNIRLFTGVHVDGFATEVVTFYDARPVGPARRVTLADSMDAQRVLLPVSPLDAGRAMETFRSSDAVEAWTFPQAVTMGLDADAGVPVRFRFILRLEIAEVYRGTRWEDTCIAEIWPDFGETIDATVADNMRRLILTTADGRSVPGYADVESVLTLAAVSSDAEWAIVIKEPAYPGPGRVSSEYAVIHVPTGRDMTGVIFGPDADMSSGAAILPFEFWNEDGATYVLYESFADGEVHRVPCRPVYPRVVGNR